MPYNPGSHFTVTSGYGRRIRNGRNDNHTGIDYGATEGTNIPAAVDGEVWYVGENTTSAYGNTVILRHTREDDIAFYTLYAHMNGVPDLRLGQQISAGDNIGQVGNSGLNEDEGHHLHFELLTPPEDVAPRRTGGGGRIGIQPDTYRSDPNSFDNWPESGVYDGSQSEDAEGMELLDGMLDGYPKETKDQAKREYLLDMETKRRGDSPRPSQCRETLVRRGKYVERIEPDCSTRGSFYSP